MSPKRVNDRYDLEAIRLRPNTSARDSMLVEAISSLQVHGTTFHLLESVPDQFEDQYIVLVDAKLVISFELLRGRSDTSAKNVQIWFLADYRRDVGQGHRRTLLDLAANAAREIAHLQNSR
ncbi:MAG: hypothetical protein JNK47_07745 [Mesorhizobium sp.]|nr:hypothetical protein [Mesorhizobium sp.]MBL8577103.1 hypothetical protein [Mesorhizobium sp.]